MSDKDFRVQVTGQDWAIKDETSKGLTCPECGALLPPMSGPVNRHRTFHERVNAFMEAQPGSLGGDNGGG